MESRQPSHRSMLSNLPTEILTLVFENFCLHCRESDANGVPQVYYPRKQEGRFEPSWYSLDLQTLYSTCLVSRRLCDIAQPILYHEFVPGYGDSWNSVQYEWTGRLTGFLRTVALRRDLANLVRGLYLSHWLLSPIFIEPTQGYAALEQTALVRGVNLSDFLKSFPLEDNGSYRPVADELITMLLSCLPNLARLYLTTTTPGNPISMEALKAAGVLRLSLQTIEVEAGGSNLRHRLGGILEMSLPTLKTLNIDSYSSFEGDKLGLSGLYFPSLRNISVTASKMSGPDLESLLSCCSGLETFIYDATSSIYSIHPCDIIKYLNRHQETLTTVRFDLRNADFINPFLPEPMPSLQLFPVLQDVALNSFHIYNDNKEQLKDGNVLCRVLPPSIVSLRLYDTVGTPSLSQLSTDLVRLAEAVYHKQFPSLKTVKCYIREQFDDYYLDLKFASAGVHLNMILGPPSDVVPRRRSSTPSSSSLGSIPSPMG
ncbi:hypothetical protein F4678DRAFT_53762 [Xylaria arbuscula]|nr:hypothetical protein F4678DRAFT_53762 [Xylaria arbuscula]